VYPPAGYLPPHPHDPHGRRPPTPPPPAHRYPPAPSPYPAAPPPVPAPPWQPPGSGPTGPTPAWKGVTVIVVAAVFSFLFCAVGIFWLGKEDNRYFTNGSRVTPTDDESIVFIRERQLDGEAPTSVQCTATTEAGRELALSPPAEVLTTIRGAKPATKYVAVAELPRDQGPLTVTCTGLRNPDLVVGKPSDSGHLVVFMIVYGVMMAILVVVVVIVRRRTFRKYPRIADDWQR